MNQKPEIGRYGDPERDDPGMLRRPGLRRGPPAGWRVATMASSLLLLSAVAGMASLMAGVLLLLPLAALAAPFLWRRRRRRAAATARSGPFSWRAPRFGGA
ncbi:MAG TPA: hypothetical protein VJ385_01985 [Fibrobacteria bacterium]|nr:hypothetical protein [Fibrobacteria bacterium]